LQLENISSSHPDQGLVCVLRKKMAAVFNTPPDLSTFLKTNFAARPAAAAQKPVLDQSAQFDSEIQTFLDCHQDEYHLRKKKKHNNKQPSMYAAPFSSPSTAPAPVSPSSVATKPVADAPSIEAVLAMMSGKINGASVAPARPSPPTGSQQQAQAGSIRRLDDKQKLTSYPY
jgi:hypothetical protein